MPTTDLEATTFAQEAVALEMMYAKLRGLKMMVDDVVRERTLEKLNKVHAVASSRERTDDKDEVEGEEVVTAQEDVNIGRWAMGRVFR